MNEFNFVNKDYMSCVREFFGRLHLENNPHKFDIIINAFSDRVFNRKSKFSNEESMHMFTFAMVILDIELNQNKGKANSKKLE